MITQQAAVCQMRKLCGSSSVQFSMIDLQTTSFKLPSHVAQAVSGIDHPRILQTIQSKTYVPPLFVTWASAGLHSDTWLP